MIDGGPDAVASAVAGAVAGTRAADHPALAPDEIRKPASIAAVPVLSETWDEVVPMMARNGLLHEPDLALVEAFVCHLVAFRDAAAELALVGPTIPGRDNGQPVKNPADLVMRAQAASLQSVARDLGLSFVSRSRLPATGTGSALDETSPDFNPFAPGAYGD